MNRQRLLWRRLALAVVLGTTFGLIWAIVGSWIGETIWQVNQADRPPGVSESLLVLSDGRLLIRSYEGRNWEGRTYRDLDGKPVELPSETEVGLPGGNLSGIGSTLPPVPMLAWIKRLRVFQDAQRPPVYWYFIHDGRENGSGYFVGYHSRSNAKVGFLGTNGFHRQAVPPNERFPVTLKTMSDLAEAWSAQASYLMDEYLSFHQRIRSDQIPGWHVYVPSGKRLYEVDLRKRTPKIVIESEAPIVQVSMLSQAADSVEEQRDWLAVRTKETIRVFNPQDETLRDHPVPDELRDESFTWYELADSHALATVSGSRNRVEGTTSITLYWISPDGKVERSKDLTLKTGSPFMSERAERSGFALLCPALLAMTTMAVILEPLFSHYGSDPTDYSTALSTSVSYYWPGLLGLSVASLVLAGWCYRHGAAFSFSGRERLAWTLFVFLFGVPGLAGYLLHRRWPVREACPECDFYAPRDDDHCHSCGTLFPEPAREGIEVFA